MVDMESVPVEVAPGVVVDAAAVAVDDDVPLFNRALVRVAIGVVLELLFLLLTTEVVK